MEIETGILGNATLARTDQKLQVELELTLKPSYEELETLGLYKLDETEAQLVAAWRRADARARRKAGDELSEYGFDYSAREREASVLRAAAKTMNIPVGTMLSLCRRQMGKDRAAELLNLVAGESRSPEESGQAVGE